MKRVRELGWGILIVIHVDHSPPSLPTQYRESLGSSLDLEELLAEHFLKRFQSSSWHSPTVGWSLLVFRGGSHFTEEQLLSWRWLMLKLGQSKDCLDPTCTNEVSGGGSWWEG